MNAKAPPADPRTPPDFARVFAAVPGLYLVLDPELRIAAVSEAFARAMNVRREKIVGRNIFAALPDNPANPAAMGVQASRASFARVLLNRGHDVVAAQRYDVRRPASDGGGFEERYWSVTNSPVLATDGSVAWILHHVADVTELEQQKAVGQAQVQVNEALLLGSLRQHELTEQAENLATRLREKIIEQQKTARELAEKARLLDLSTDAIVVRDFQGRVLYWNHGAESLYGWSRAEALGQTTRALLRTKRPIPLQQITAELQRNGHWTGELVHAKRNGQRITVLARKVLDRDSEGRPAAVLETNTDITERKRTEEALRVARVQLARHADQLEKLVATRTKQLTATNRRLESSISSIRKGHEQFRVLWLESQAMQKKLRRLTHQILTAQEEERKKISRELHDEVVQALVGINVELSALVHGNSTQVRQMKDKVSRTQRMVEKAVDSVHRFARDLRPAVLDDLGLIPALHAYCRDLAARKKIKIRMTAFGGVEALDSDKRTVFYRVAQEALNNIARHARASHVELTISRQPGTLRLEIADNGKAFSVKKILLAKSNKRLGLVGMKERVEMVGGTLTIESVRGRGTTVRADIPFTPEKKSK